MGLLALAAVYGTGDFRTFRSPVAGKFGSAVAGKAGEGE
jgi:hypothetical protein